MSKTAKQARKAWSSSAVGAPNTAMMPSPVNLSTVPPYRRTTAAEVSTSSVMISRNRSAPTAAAMSMECTTSANSTVTCLYSAGCFDGVIGDRDASRVATWLRCQVLAAWSWCGVVSAACAATASSPALWYRMSGFFAIPRADDLIEPARHPGSMLTGSGRVQRQMPGDLLLHALARIGPIAGEALI